MKVLKLIVVLFILALLLGCIENGNIEKTSSEKTNQIKNEENKEEKIINEKINNESNKTEKAESKNNVEISEEKIKWIIKDVDVNATQEELNEIKNAGFDIIHVEWGLKVGMEKAKEFLEKAKKAGLYVVMDAGFSPAAWGINEENKIPKLQEEKLTEWINALKSYENIYAWDICNEYGTNFRDYEEGENEFPIYLEELREAKNLVKNLDPKRKILIRMHDWDYEELNFDLKDRYEKGLADIFMLNMYSNWIGEGENAELIKDTEKYIQKIKAIDPDVEIWVAIASFEEMPYFKKPESKKLEEEIEYLMNIKDIKGIGFYGFGSKERWYLPRDGKDLWETIKDEINKNKEDKGELNEKEKQEQTSEKKEKRWHYQLQNADFDELKNLDVDYVVVDIDDADLSKEQIEELNEEGIQVLSYLSIGEAEDYRDYWKGYWKVGHPDYIVAENPEWEGNYKVEYWNREWQRIIFDRLDDIVENGYNGVYLDIIDAYEYFEDRRDVDSKKEMIEFVKRISQLAKNKNPEFLIIPQNAVELYEEEDYKEAIDGFGKEDTWYDEDGSLKKEGLEYMREAKDDGKIILAVDYPLTKKDICSFYENCWKEGFYCTVEDRELSMDEPIECK